MDTSHQNVRHHAKRHQIDRQRRVLRRWRQLHRLHFLVAADTGGNGPILQTQSRSERVPGTQLCVMGLDRASLREQEGPRHLEKLGRAGSLRHHLPTILFLRSGIRSQRLYQGSRRQSRHALEGPANDRLLRHLRPQRHLQERDALPRYGHHLAGRIQAEVIVHQMCAATRCGAFQ